MKKIIVFLLALLFACNCASSPQVKDSKYEPVNVKDSVYKVIVYQGGYALGSGTGFKIEDGVLLTAGHVCEPSTEGATFELVDADDARFAAFPIRTSHDPDLCIMAAPGIHGDSLDVFFEGVKYGDVVWYTGAPQGLYGGVAPFDSGYSTGPDTVVLRSARGASGSPIYTKEGVAGVLVGQWPNTLIFKIETADKIKKFLAEESK